MQHFFVLSLPTPSLREVYVKLTRSIEINDNAEIKTMNEFLE